MVSASAAIAAPAHAYRTYADDPEVRQAAGWSQAPIRWSLSLNGLDESGLDQVSWREAVLTAFATWEGAECRPLSSEMDEESAGLALLADGQNSLELVAEGWTERGFPDRPAFTEVSLRTLSDGTVIIVEADIFLDASRYTFVNRAPGPGELDLRAVLLHEVGHFLGLLHSCGEDDAPECGSADVLGASVMRPDYGGDGLALGQDDVAGVCAIYVTGPGCSLSCPDGRECQSGQCVDPVCGAVSCDAACDGDGPCDEGLCLADGTCTAGDCALAGYNEGYCVRAGTTGTTCELGVDCESRLCLTSERAGSYCTTRCSSDAECGGMQRCADVDGHQVCAPLPPSGCAVSPGALPGHGTAIWFALMALYFRKRTVDR